MPPRGLPGTLGLHNGHRVGRDGRTHGRGLVAGCLSRDASLIQSRMESTAEVRVDRHTRGANQIPNLPEVDRIVRSTPEGERSERVRVHGRHAHPVI
jgi:hypothetical protein